MGNKTSRVRTIKYLVSRILPNDRDMFNRYISCTQRYTKRLLWYEPDGHFDAQMATLLHICGGPSFADKLGVEPVLGGANLGVVSD